MVCTFSVVQPKALSAYKNIAFENLKLSNEKSLVKWFAPFP